MRKTLVLFFVFAFLSVSMFAQVRTGNVYGTVVDEEDNPLPGVSVTLTGQYTAPQTAVTGAEGRFRFLSLPPAKDYVVRLELAGFKVQVEEGIIVTVGGNTELSVTMEMGAIEEEVTVTAVTPVVDTKKTSVGTNVTQEVLQSLPTARDPWVVLQMAPGVLADRENVGGTESGMQSTMTGRGASSGAQNVWAMDGVVITDPAAIGASPSYYDFDAFEEMQITVGGADVTQQTGGIGMNLVTRRGGNRVSLGGRFYYTDGTKFQGENITEEFKQEGLIDTNKIRIITDYGFNLGVPLVRDKAWAWGSFGVQDIQTDTIYGTPSDVMLTNFAGKLNLQLHPNNRVEAFLHVGKKEMWGRGASATDPEGDYQGGAYHFGSPIVKFQVEQMFGDDLFISARGSWSDSGFSLTPMMDRDKENMMIFDYGDYRYYGSTSHYNVSRPHYQANISANYFNDNLFGLSHEMQFGVELSDRSAWTESVYTANSYIYRNYTGRGVPVADLTGDGYRDVPPENFYYFHYRRGYWRDYGVNAYAGYFSDTVSIGNFNVLLGLRYDYQAPRVKPIDIQAVIPDAKPWQDYVKPNAINAFDSLLPGISIPEVKATTEDGSRYAWTMLSPRIGLTWDVAGDGKTIAKLNLAQYGNFMGVSEAGYWMPGGASGGVNTYWWDHNNDGMIDINEVYWLYRRTPGKYYQPYRIFDDQGNFIGDVDDAAGIYWYGYDYYDPMKLEDPYTIFDNDLNQSRTSEIMLTLEREIIPDLAVQVNASYRRYDRYRWNLKYFPETGEYRNRSWYVSAGTPPANLPGFGSTKEAAQHEYYYQIPEATQYSPWSRMMMRPDRYNDWMALDFIVNKRLSNRWMLNANFTLQHQASHYPEGSYYDPTNLWAIDGKPYSPYVGGAAGKINQYTFSRWMLKAGGLWQAPFGINVSFNFNAREGWIILESLDLVDYTIPNPLDQEHELYMTEMGSDRLPLFYNMSLRLEKMITYGEFGRIYIMGDLFNVLNTAIENRRYQKYHGTYHYYGEDHPNNRFVPYANYYELNEILNPRVLRLGVRFQF
ncbi:MAG: carboxypeptidase regulatory-like domain-containing protein [Candidatus Aminicenantes bacterium]